MGGLLAAIIVHLGLDVGVVNASEGSVLRAAEDPGGPVGGVRAELAADQPLDRSSRRGLDVANRIRKAVVPEDPVDGPEQWVVFAAAPVGEVIQIEGPDHGPAEPVVQDELRLLPDGLGVVEADPLEAGGSVGPHPLDLALGVPVHDPAFVLDAVANLESHQTFELLLWQSN